MEILPRPATLAVRVACDGTPGDETATALAALVQRHPAATDLGFALACCLEQLGRTVAARAAYDAVLTREPAHFGALTNLATLYLVDGDAARARELFARAVASRPNLPGGRLNLGLACAETGDAGAAAAAYDAALRLAPGYPGAHLALGLLCTDSGDGARAEAHCERAFAEPIVDVGAYRGCGPALEILQLVSAYGGNVVTTLFFDDRTVRLTTLVVESWRLGRDLPPHDVIFNAVGDVERSAAAVERCAAIVAASGAPSINDPRPVAGTSRAAIAQRLAAIDGVVAPRTALVPRARAAAEITRQAFTFPLLLRAPGYHTGEALERVAVPGEVDAAATRLPGDALYAIEFRDTGGPDSTFRKYRVLFVDGELYPLHLAIAPHWKVHYFSAGMGERAQHRAEEAAFLADMPGTIGPRAMGALARVRDVLGLDYGGIDFALTLAGEVLAFEANATMAIYLPESDPRFDYRRAPALRAVAAVRRMINASAGRAVRSGN